jgi:hypothetical protein
MGRPIKKTFFGNLNTGSASALGDDGIGGEGVTSSITVISSGTNYSRGSVVTFSAPQLPGGVIATGTPTLPTLGGGITAVTLTEGGSGYTSTATISVTKPATVTSTVNSGVTATNTMTVSTTAGIYIGMLIAGAATGSSGYVTAINGNVITSTVPNNDNWTNAANLTFSDAGTGAAFFTALTASQLNAIAGVAYIPGGASAVAYDIIKQEASHRYLVKTAQGTGQCKLVAAAPGAGEMTIIATDTQGCTYYVTKLTAHRAVLTRKTSAGTGYQFATGDVAGWNITGAVTGFVSIATN